MPCRCFHFPDSFPQSIMRKLPVTRPTYFAIQMFYFQLNRCCLEGFSPSFEYIHFYSLAMSLWALFSCNIRIQVTPCSWVVEEGVPFQPAVFIFQDYINGPQGDKMRCFCCFQSYGHQESFSVKFWCSPSIPIGVVIARFVWTCSQSRNRWCALCLLSRYLSLGSV